MRKKTITLFTAFNLFLLAASAQQPCKDSLPVSFLLNPSFEAYSACNPYWRGEGGIIDGNSSAVNVTVEGWHPENTIQFIRYYNYDCRRSFGSIFAHDFSILDTGFPGIPDSLPAGKGLVSIEQYNIGFDGPLPEKETNKKYITACLTTPMQAGKTYGFAFDFGFGKFNPNYNDVTGFWAAPSPFVLGIFGRTDCPSFPIQRRFDSAAGCLADRPGWISLGTIKLQGKSKWIHGYLEFTPSVNISSIGIGPSCDYNENIADTFALYYMDNFILSEKPAFDFTRVTIKSGSTCTGNFVLQAPQFSDAQYQWYKDGKSIAGATAETYAVPNLPLSEGSYTVNITRPNACYQTLPYDVAFAAVHKLSLGSDKTICDSTAIKLHATLPGISKYIWQNGSTDSVFTATASGIYTVTAVDDDGCKQTASVNLTFSNCSNCKIFLPNAFTPNNDGLNDVFRPKPFCNNVPLQFYHIAIYTRWGQLIYSSYNSLDGWNGTFQNIIMPQGTYVYNVDYNFFPGKNLHAQGTVVVVR